MARTARVAREPNHMRTTQLMHVLPLVPLARLLARVRLLPHRRTAPSAHLASMQIMWLIHVSPLVLLARLPTRDRPLPHRRTAPTAQLANMLITWRTAAFLHVQQVKLLTRVLQAALDVKTASPVLVANTQTMRHTSVSTAALLALQQMVPIAI